MQFHLAGMHPAAHGETADHGVRGLDAAGVRVQDLEIVEHDRKSVISARRSARRDGVELGECEGDHLRLVEREASGVERFELVAERAAK